MRVGSPALSAYTVRISTSEWLRIHENQGLDTWGVNPPLHTRSRPQHCRDEHAGQHQPAKLRDAKAREEEPLRSAYVNSVFEGVTHLRKRLTSTFSTPIPFNSLFPKHMCHVRCQARSQRNEWSSRTLARQRLRSRQY